MSNYKLENTEQLNGDTHVTASFTYGDVTEVQTYVFSGTLSESEVAEKLAVILAEYQSKWEAQQAAEAALFQ